MSMKTFWKFDSEQHQRELNNMAPKLSGKKFKGQTDFQHGRQAKLGILFVNLGTPDAATTPAVRRYLAEFLSDPRVIEIPALIWKIILHGIILRVRPSKSAAAYQRVWSDKGSPLLAASQDLVNKIDQSLQKAYPDQVITHLAMRYGQPSIESQLEKLHLAGAERLMVLPLYPQYSGATTGTVADEVFRVIAQWRWVPGVYFDSAYFDDPAYIEAVAAQIQENWLDQGKPGKLCLSFHGMPKATLLAGDPYFCHCHKTARLIAEKLALQEDEWEMAFQSRFGKAEWLKPYFAQRIEQWPGEGVDEVTVICPGFAVDCLETLDEIAIEGKHDFIEAGGRNLSYLPALNDSDAHVQFWVNRINRQISGWYEHQSSDDMSDSKRTQSLAKKRGALS